MAHPMSSINTGLLDPTEDSHNTRYSHIEEISIDEILSSTKHKQAGLLLRKGRDNEKFINLITSRVSELSYEIVHHPVYLWFNFLTAICLLLLAIGERPSVNVGSTNGGSTHVKESSFIVLIELLLLAFLSINIILRLAWLELKLFIKSRGIFVAIIMAMMILEALVILGRGERHMRFTRALRPFILLDTFLMSGVRRVVRQIFLCLKYIFDVMLVLFFLIAIFSITAYFLFARTDPTYFSDLDKSFVSMLITLTTANHPDVFLEAYKDNRVAPLFFMVYMLVTFYYFSNVLLAVVFAKFKEAEKKKYKKLFIHRRKALKEAYNTLKVANENGVSFGDFLRCMQEFQPQITIHEIMCVFKSLKQMPTECNDYILSWNEFSNLYDNIGLKWDLTHQGGFEISWYDELKYLKPRGKASMKTIHDGIRHWLFDSVMVIVVIINLLYLIIAISLIEKDCEDAFGRSGIEEKNEKTDDQFCAVRQLTPGSFIFLIIYMLEISVRLFFDGPIKYFRKRWNTVDFMLVFGSFICLVIEVSLTTHFISNSHNYHDMYRYLAIARPLVLLRLLKLKRNYLYLIRIMIVLAERMISVFFLLVIVYYIYAIIGMEIFTGNENSVAYNCCDNAWYGVGEYYQSSPLSNDSANLYWLNNFNNLWSSYVTLYELMVVNNWFIIMEGFVSTTSDAARIFFILFWITTTLVVNTAIVYIVDAFESGILALNIQEQDKSTSTTIPTINNLKRIIHLQLTNDDISVMEKVIDNNTNSVRNYFSIRRLFRKYKTISCDTIRRHDGEFRGKRIMNNHDLRQFIYNTEVEMWSQEFDQQQYNNNDNNRQSVSIPLRKSLAISIKNKIRDLVSYIIG